MASAMYPLCRQRLLEWFSNATTPTGITWCAIGVDDNYAYNASHENVSDVNALAITAPEKELQNTTYTNGYLNADDVLFDGLDDADEIHAVIVYAKWSGGDLLFAYLDETADGSLPQPIDATRGLISWNDDGIFRI